MTQTPVKLSFAEYLTYDDDTDTHYELVDGALVEMPPATHKHRRIARFLETLFRQEIAQARLEWETARNGEVGIRTKRKTRTTVRLPDVVVFDGAAIADSNGVAVLETPPFLVVEVVSPGEQNRKRDYEQKSREYQSLEVPEYWIVDPQDAAQKVTILVLVDGVYEETEFVGSDGIISPTFPNLSLTAEQVLAA